MNKFPPLNQNIITMLSMVVQHEAQLAIYMSIGHIHYRTVNPASTHVLGTINKHEHWSSLGPDFTLILPLNCSRHTCVDNVG